MFLNIIWLKKTQNKTRPTNKQTNKKENQQNSTDILLIFPSTCMLCDHSLGIAVKKHLEIFLLNADFLQAITWNEALPDIE